MTTSHMTKQTETGADRPDVGWSFLRTPRWMGYYALLVVFAVVCVLLGNWQFARRAEAQAEIARIDAHYDAPAIPLNEALPTRDGFDEDALKWQTVTVTGTYDDRVFLARNRPAAGGVGSVLIQALRADDGRVFFIDRGWVPIAGSDQVPSDLPRAASGEVTVQARLRAGEPEIQGRTASGDSVPSINLPLLAELYGVEGYALTGAYGQLVSETPPSETGTIAPKPERDEGPHLAYALQWYVFIVVAFSGAAYAAWLEHRALNAASGVLPAPPKRRRVGQLDADAEDALLDG